MLILEYEIMGVISLNSNDLLHKFRLKIRGAIGGKNFDSFGFQKT